MEGKAGKFMKCSAKTKSGKQCRNKAQANTEFCGVHSKLAEDVRSRFEYDVFLSTAPKTERASMLWPSV